MFKISPGSEIALSFYSSIMPARKPNAQKVNGANNKQLRSTQRFVCSDTDKVLYRQEIGTYYPAAGAKVPVSVEEMRAVKKFDRVGITLMGFKPRSFLKPYHNVKHSTFVFPDEKKVIGSQQCADALIKEMIRKDKIAIVRAQARDNASVRFCAMLPQDESFDEDFGLQTPPGFQLVVLPYAEDIRDLSDIKEAAGLGQADAGEEVPVVDTLKQEEKNAARLLIKNLTIDFNSRNFENPSIQTFYSGLQALALNEEEPEPVEDLLEPDYEEMQRFQPVVQKFKNAFFGGNDSDSELSMKANPRSRGAGARKQPKPVEVIHEKIDLGSDEEAKEPSKKRPRTNGKAPVKSENLS